MLSTFSFFTISELFQNFFSQASPQKKTTGNWLCSQSAESNH